MIRGDGHHEGEVVGELGVYGTEPTCAEGMENMIPVLVRV